MEKRKKQKKLLQKLLFKKESNMIELREKTGRKRSRLTKGEKS